MIFLSTVPQIPASSLRDILSFTTCGLISADEKQVQRRRTIEAVRASVDNTFEAAQCIAKAAFASLTGKSIQAFRTAGSQGSTLAVDVLHDSPALPLSTAAFLVHIQRNMRFSMSEREPVEIHPMQAALVQSAKVARQNGLYNCLQAIPNKPNISKFKQFFFHNLRTAGVSQKILDTMSHDLLLSCYVIGIQTLQTALEGHKIQPTYFTGRRQVLLDLEALAIRHLDVETAGLLPLTEIAKRVQKSGYMAVRILLEQLMTARKIHCNQEGSIVPTPSFAWHENTILETNEASPNQLEYYVPLDVGTVYKIAMQKLSTLAELGALVHVRHGTLQCRPPIEKHLNQWLLEVLSAHPRLTPGAALALFYKLYPLFAQTIITESKLSDMQVRDVERIEALLERPHSLDWKIPEPELPPPPKLSAPSAPIKQRYKRLAKEVSAANMLTSRRRS